MKYIATYAVIVATIAVIGVIGWLKNIIFMFTAPETIGISEAVLRGVGVLLFPLGAVLGWI